LREREKKRETEREKKWKRCGP